MVPIITPSPLAATKVAMELEEPRTHRIRQTDQILDTFKGDVNAR